mgnify:CR=1 FL=1
MSSSSEAKDPDLVIASGMKCSVAISRFKGFIQPQKNQNPESRIQKKSKEPLFCHSERSEESPVLKVFKV